LLLTRDGGLFTVGDARYEGSVPGLGWCPGPGAVALARTTTAAGYWILLSDGQIVAFGDAKAWGAPPISTRAPLRSRRSAERTH